MLESLKDCDYDVDATIAYVLQTMETMKRKYILQNFGLFLTLSTKRSIGLAKTD